MSFFYAINNGNKMNESTRVSKKFIVFHSVCVIMYSCTLISFSSENIFILWFYLVATYYTTRCGGGISIDRDIESHCSTKYDILIPCSWCDKIRHIVIIIRLYYFNKKKKKKRIYFLLSSLYFFTTTPSHTTTTSYTTIINIWNIHHNFYWTTPTPRRDDTPCDTYNPLDDIFDLLA